MIITKIRLQERVPMTDGTSSWPLPFCDFHLDHHAGENGYLLKAAQGLGPPDFTSVVEGFDIYGNGMLDSLPSTRDIILRIGLVPIIGKSPSELRDDIYKFISKSVTLSLMDKSLTTASIPGFIKRVETVQFSATPEFQITIECYEALFSAPEALEIPLSLLNTADPVIVYEDGTAPTGFDLEFTVSGVVSGWKIENFSNYWYGDFDYILNKFEVTHTSQAGDVYRLSTHPGNRRLTVVRSSVEYDLAGNINAGAVWPRLHPGVNAFSWNISSLWATIDSMSYIPRWWGV